MEVAEKYELDRYPPLPYAYLSDDQAIAIQRAKGNHMHEYHYNVHSSHSSPHLQMLPFIFSHA